MAQLKEISTRPLQLLTISGFAARLGISVWTARAWAYAGRIESIKVGSRLQVPESEVERIVNAGRRPHIESPKLARTRCGERAGEA
jgi:excisionase family DNA binding protein